MTDDHNESSGLRRLPPRDAVEIFWVSGFSTEGCSDSGPKMMRRAYRGAVVHRFRWRSGNLWEAIRRGDVECWQAAKQRAAPAGQELAERLRQVEDPARTVVAAHSLGAVVALEAVRRLGAPAMSDRVGGTFAATEASPAPPRIGHVALFGAAAPADGDHPIWASAANTLHGVFNFHHQEDGILAMLYRLMEDHDAAGLRGVLNPPEKVINRAVVPRTPIYWAQQAIGTAMDLGTLVLLRKRGLGAVGRRAATRRLALVAAAQLAKLSATRVRQITDHMTEGYLREYVRLMRREESNIATGLACHDA